MKTELLISLFKKNYPYPKDVFISPTKEQLGKFYEVLKYNEMSPDAFMRYACRIGYDVCVFIIESNQETIKFDQGEGKWTLN